MITLRKTDKTGGEAKCEKVLHGLQKRMLDVSASLKSSLLGEKAPLRSRVSAESPPPGSAVSTSRGSSVASRCAHQKIKKFWNYFSEGFFPGYFCDLFSFAVQFHIDYRI